MVGGMPVENHGKRLTAEARRTQRDAEGRGEIGLVSTCACVSKAAPVVFIV